MALSIRKWILFFSVVRLDCSAQMTYLEVNTPTSTHPSRKDVTEDGKGLNASYTTAVQHGKFQTLPSTTIPTTGHQTERVQSKCTRFGEERANCRRVVEEHAGRLGLTNNQEQGPQVSEDPKEDVQSTEYHTKRPQLETQERSQVTKDQEELSQISGNHSEGQQDAGGKTGRVLLAGLTNESHQFAEDQTEIPQGTGVTNNERTLAINKVNITSNRKGKQDQRNRDTIVSTDERQTLSDKLIPKENANKAPKTDRASNSPKQRRRNRNATTAEEEEQQRLLSDLNYFGFIYFHPLMIFIGTVCNIVTVTVLAQGVLRSSSSVYMGSIAGIQIVYTICRLFTTFKEISPYSYTFTMIYAYAFAYVLPAKTLFFLTLSWLTVAFTLERYVAICHPLKASLICTRRNATISVTVVSIICMLLRSTDFLRRRVDTMTQRELNATIPMAVLTPLGESVTNTQFLQISGLLALLSALVILVIANILIIQRLYSSKKRRELYTNARNVCNAKTVAMIKQNNQIVRILLLHVAAFLLCNTAEIFINALRTGFGSKGKRSFNWEMELAICLSRNISVCNPLFNFIIYICCSSALRKAVHNLFASCCRKRNVEERFSQS